jgi:hypothetical protein
VVRGIESDFARGAGLSVPVCQSVDRAFLVALHIGLACDGYSHIRMEVKRTALESIVKKSANKDTQFQRNGEAEVLQQGGPHELQNNDSTVQPANSSKAKK